MFKVTRFEERNEVFRSKLPLQLSERLKKRINASPIVDTNKYQNELSRKLISNSSNPKKYKFFLSNLLNVYDFAITAKKLISFDPNSINSEESVNQKNFKRDMVSKQSIPQILESLHKRSLEINSDEQTIKFEELLLMSHFFGIDKIRKYFNKKDIESLFDLETREEISRLILPDYGFAKYKDSTIQISHFHRIGALSLYENAEYGDFGGVCIGLEIFINAQHMQERVRKHELSHGFDTLISPWNYNWRSEYRAKLAELIGLDVNEIPNHLEKFNNKYSKNGEASKYHKIADQKVRINLGQFPSPLIIRNLLNQEYIRLTGIFGFYGLSFDEILEPIYRQEII